MTESSGRCQISKGTGRNSSATGSRTGEYEYLEKEAFETEYGVTGLVKERKAAWKENYVRLNIMGTVLCILGVVPLFVYAIGEGSNLAGSAVLCVTILIEGIGCMALCLSGGHGKVAGGRGLYQKEQGEAGVEGRNQSVVLAYGDRGFSFVYLMVPGGTAGRSTAG